MASYTLTSVAVSGGTTTYNGTITGGAANAYVGYIFTASLFTNAGNNVTFTVTASTATTLQCVTSTQVNETDPAYATLDGTTLYGMSLLFITNRASYSGNPPSVGGLVLGNIPVIPPPPSGGPMTITF